MRLAFPGAAAGSPPPAGQMLCLEHYSLQDLACHYRQDNLVVSVTVVSSRMLAPSRGW